MPPAQRFNIACKRFETTPEGIFSLLNTIDSYFANVFKKQNLYLTYANFEQRERVMENGVITIKFKNEKNPNQEILDQSTNLNRDNSLGVKNIATIFGEEISKNLRPLEGIPELKDQHTSPLIDTVIATCKSSTLPVVQEKMEAYLFRQLQKL